jgi:hypothetical protein
MLFLGRRDVATPVAAGGLGPMHVSKLRKRTVVVAAVATVIAAASVAVAHAATGAGSPVTRFSATHESASTCTNSTTYVNIPQTTTQFTMGGSTNDEVLVMFTASMNMFPGTTGQIDAADIRLTIDGTLLQSPLDVRVLESDDTGSVAFNWPTGALTPGAHTARVQWKTQNGNMLCAAARSLTVLTK